VTFEKLKELLTVIQAKMGWFHILHEKPFWYKGIKVNETKNSSQDEEILNSFYARDLERIMDCIGKKKQGEALLSYLSGDRIPASQRRDINKDKILLSQVLSPRIYTRCKMAF
jgi:hypothetical protein